LRFLLWMEGRDGRPQNVFACSSTLEQTGGQQASLVAFTPSEASPDFDADTGVYTCSVDGLFLVSVRPSLPLPSGLLALHYRHESGETFVHCPVVFVPSVPSVDESLHVGCSARRSDASSSRGSSGSLMHLRARDSLRVLLLALPASPPAGLAVTLRVELVMRKHKRRREFDESDYGVSPRDGAGRQRGGAIRARGGGRKASEVDAGEAPSTDRTAEPDPSPAPEEADSRGEGGESTGSDTEWSEGFSSDDEAKRSRRLPKHTRRVMRLTRELQVQACPRAGEELATEVVPDPDSGRLP